jgi:quinol monooxygenase YgiN
MDVGGGLVQTAPKCSTPLRSGAHKGGRRTEEKVLSLIANLRVKEGQEEEARGFFRELAQKVTETEPGTLTYNVHQRKDDPRAFVVYERYESPEAFKTHSANLAQHGTRFAGVLDGRPELIFLEEI